MPQTQETTGAQPSAVCKRRGARRRNRRSLRTTVAASRSSLLRWSYLDRCHLELVFGRHLGRYRDRTLAYYWAFCRHPRSSLRATIVSTVTEAAAGRTFSLAAPDRIGVDTSHSRRAPRSAPAGTRRPAAASRPGAASCVASALTLRTITVGFYSKCGCELAKWHSPSAREQRDGYRDLPLADAHFPCRCAG